MFSQRDDVSRLNSESTAAHGEALCLDSVITSQARRASLVAQRVKNPPAMRETWVQSLGWEDPLEKEMAIHSSILAWEIPWTEEPGGLQSMGSQELDTT